MAWSSLSGDASQEGWQAIALPSAGAVGVEAGRHSPDGAEAILLNFPSAKLAPAEKLPQAQGFTVEKTESKDAERLSLALTRQAAGSMELFSAMACDVVGAMDDAAAAGAAESRLLRVFIGRVNAWQQFMSRGASPLGPEAELGLAGELAFMGALLNSGVSIDQTVRSWMGPDDAPQDFLLGDGAVEVKATMSTSGFPVKISSLEQLDDSTASPLFLAAIKFTRDEGGLALPDMITEVERGLKGEPQAVAFLKERLMAAGYAEAHMNHYTRRFALIEMRILSVSAGFPRLTTGSVPVGVTRGLYEINLDHAGEFLTNLESALKTLGVIG